MVVGGYGRVGSLVARGLVKELGHHVIIAGRDRDRARDFSTESDLRITDRRLDVNNPASLPGNFEQVGLIINCAGQRKKPYLAAAAIEKGLRYIDLTVDYQMIAGTIAMQDRAAEKGARLIVGCGLSPGLINLMAGFAAKVAQRAEALHSYTHLEVGTNTSELRRRELLDLTCQFPIMEGRYGRATTNYAESRAIDFPAPLGRRTAYRFAFPDQFFYRDTLDVANCASWLSLESKGLGALLHGLAKPRIGRLMGNRRFNALAGRLAGPLIKGAHEGSGWMLMVKAAGKHVTRRVAAAGRHGVAETAARFVIELVRWLDTGAEIEPGVWLPEEILALDDFIDPMTADGCRISAEDLPHDTAAADWLVRDGHEEPSGHTRIRPSWVTEATRVPPWSNSWPRLKPRALTAVGLS